MKFWIPKASQREVRNPKNPILRNDWKIFPTWVTWQGWGGKVDPGRPEIPHATLKGGTAANIVNSS